MFSEKIIKSGAAYLLLVLLYFIPFSLLQAQSAPKTPITIVFKNMVDSLPLQLLKNYQNPFGEDYAVAMFKYYISDISLKNSAGETIRTTGSHLVNEADSSTKSFTLNASAGKYDSISFLIGVDSIYNVSGTQTGDLDPLNGMFWTWNSGYIMAKLEATSTLSTTANKSINYHIGGYKTAENTARLVWLEIPADKGKNISELVIEANLNKLFNGSHNLKIADHAVCTTPGSLAVLYADNYATMFSIGRLK